MKILDLMILTILLYTTVYSQEVTYLKCDSLKTQADMNYCFKENYNRATNELEQTWQKVLFSLKRNRQRINNNVVKDDSEYVKSVIKRQENIEQSVLMSQNKWAEYMESNCGIQAALYYGGSMQSMQIDGCKFDIIQQRIKELLLLIDDLNK